ncbi:MBL fold metallo-hydrolase [Microbacterium sp. NC79]|uniref:MBL fold metallo-hydrolase n=1 Tax=Microbacterium sp. NC79 TaxID=2851009 RepID=UPI001C2B7F62|nr:MBL fold metallo-hydrolase [Microbacterium sp. NC79]MBV0896139.1 MBL fold metallo-hydrolase [Microbacterium sp. NC79]
MMRAASEAQVMGWAERQAPGPEKVADGVWALSLPGSHSAIAYTITYLFERPEGLLLVDTGWHKDEAMQGLHEALASLGWTVNDITAIAITHMHPDHFGLVPTLMRANPDIVLYMHDADLMLVDGRADDERARTMHEWLALMNSMGAPDRYDMTNRIIPSSTLDPTVASRCRAITTGDGIDAGDLSLRAIWTPGHTPGHLCFAVEPLGLLITGDHILPTITPQVTQLSDPSRDVLDDYLTSLMRVRNGEWGVALPAHQYRFTGLVERIDQLLAHHENRLNILRAEILRAPGQTCFELAHVLDWREPLADMPIDQARMAIKEAFAHIIYLQRRGEIRAEGTHAHTWWPASLGNEGEPE